MTEEFNIFKNLEDLKKTNFLDQLKSLEADNTEELNNSQDLDIDSFDFDSLVNNNVKSNSTKRQQPVEKKIATNGKKSKTNLKSRRSSVTSDGSISPTMPLLEHLNKKVNEIPILRRSRRSLEGRNKNTKTNTIVENTEPLASKSSTGKGKGRGRGRAKARNSKNIADTSSTFVDNITDISLCVPSSHSPCSEVLTHDNASGHVLESFNNNTETDIIVENTETLASKISRFKEGSRGRSRGRGRSSKNTAGNSSTDVHNSTDSSVCVPSSHNAGSNVLTIMDHLLQQGRRGRRQYLAEVAARSVPIDSIDLVSSPMPRVEGFIDLDSDTEEPARITRAKKKNQEILNISLKKNNAPTTINSVDISFDEENPELNIKVNWKGTPEAFKLRKYQKFSIIFKQISEREKISMESIVFNLNNRIITADDTPDSINYKIFHFIDGRVLSNGFNSTESVAVGGKKRDANIIALKIQSDKWKRPLQISIMKTDTFRILYIKCAEELKIGIDQFKLSFDGELLQLNDTPVDLDLEGGEAIDLRIK